MLLKIKKPMKKAVFFLFFIGCIVPFGIAQNINKESGQSKKDEKKQSWKMDTSEFEGIEVRKFGEDTLPNFRYMVVRNDRENHSTTAYFLNSEYVHSYIGIDIDKIRKIGQEKKQKWGTSKFAPRDSFFIIEGKAFDSYTSYNCEEYEPHLVTLWDLQKKYAPNILPKKCLFMIDDVLVTKDLIRYKLDENYIDSVIVISPKQIQMLDKEKYLDFYLFHIYTKGSETRKSTAFQTKKKHIIGGNRNNYENEIEPLSLQDILDQNIPNNIGPEGGYMFMINEQFLLSDLADIRINPDYIHTVRIYIPTELERLSGGVHNYLTIIRIYVKDPETMKKSKGAIVWGEGDVQMSY